MHFSSIAKVASLTHTHSHEAGEHVPPPCDSKVPHKIVTITTLEEFDQVLEDHHHRRVVVFCVTTDYEDPGVGSYASESHGCCELTLSTDQEGWYHHYEKLNDTHFVRVEVDNSPPLEERLQPKTKPCWFTFHKGTETGWSSGGMKRFVQVHSERKGSQ